MLTVVVATLVSYAAGWAIGVPLLVPPLNTAAAWVVMARALGRGQVVRAIAVMLVWAATMAVASTTMSAFGWSRSGRGDLFLQATYRDEMLHWVRTGQGAESEPAVFLPRHAASTSVFLLTSLATGGVLSMPMGAMLTNSMGEYVGAMAAGSRRPWVSAILGWHPWAVLRVIGFVVLGVLLSAVLISRVRRVAYSLSRHRIWLAAAGLLLVLDVGLKILLAPTWAVVLRGVAEW